MPHHHLAEEHAVAARRAADAPKIAAFLAHSLSHLQQETQEGRQGRGAEVAQYRVLLWVVHSKALSQKKKHLRLTNWPHVWSHCHANF
jgi:hypothetical protein